LFLFLLFAIKIKKTKTKNGGKHICAGALSGKRKILNGPPGNAIFGCACMARVQNTERKK